MLCRSRKFLKFLSFILAIGIILLIFSHYMDLNAEEAKEKFLIMQEDLTNAEINEAQLVDLHDFQYRIKSSLCKEFDRDLMGVMIVTSYVGHDEVRSAHRQAISQSKLNEMGLLRVFLLADIPAKEKFIRQKQIEDEDRKFGDLVQGNFIEAYRNLTYKHIMGLKWAATECEKAKFLIKLDDDTVFDIFFIKNYLENLEIRDNVKNFMAGYVLNNKKPIRVSANKWFVSRQEYDTDTYPDYLSGWLYLTNMKVARNLVKESQGAKFFWIDDTFVTGILRDSLAVPLMRLNHWFSANAEFLDCCVRDLKDHSYECEFYVGPNGGDNKLIVEFIHEVEKCYFDECMKRSPEMGLRQTCVGKAKDLLADHGEALIRSVHLR